MGWAPGVGGYWTNFFTAIIFPCFPRYQYNGSLLNFMVIFDRCHHSSAPAIHIKYELDFKKLPYNFVISNISMMEELPHKALATPIPGEWPCTFWVQHLQQTWLVHKHDNRLVLALSQNASGSIGLVWVQYRYIMVCLHQVTVPRVLLMLEGIQNSGGV